MRDDIVNWLPSINILSRRAVSFYGYSLMYHVWRKKGVHTGFWWGDLREGDHLGDPSVDGRIILKWIFKTWDGT
jgi:hypothetical protein